MKENCIMPEQPYCPACMYGYIEQEFDDPTHCEWHCLKPINTDDGQPINWERSTIGKIDYSNR